MLMENPSRAIQQVVVPKQQQGTRAEDRDLKSAMERELGKRSRLKTLRDAKI